MHTKEGKLRWFAAAEGADTVCGGYGKDQKDIHLQSFAIHDFKCLQRVLEHVLHG